MSSRAITSDRSSVAEHAPATPLDDMASIVAAYEQRIFRFHLISIRDRDVAQSLTQDTFVRAWSARNTFR
jgi:RNA polymerase sigma-70 factor, ECF subfamily